MIYVCYVLFALGLIFYTLAAFNTGSDTGETLSDVANGVMLITTVILLLRAELRARKS
jgi:hypothetical protein